MFACRISPNGKMQALPVLIRFYLSIEDGECVVERDLGDLKAILEAHKNGKDALADDVVMAQSDPIGAGDIRPDPGHADSSAGVAAGRAGLALLGPKGRRWATLWREVHGARLGCYSAHKRNKVHHLHCKRPGTYAAAKAGVLAAAEYAVATQMER